MKIDFATLAFGYSVKVGGATPNWATALGQGKEHKINDDPEIDEILKGMTYSSVSLEKVTTKIGKGGNVVAGNVIDSPIILASVFNKVYVNDILIADGKYVLLITRDTSKSHVGRLRLKYGPSNTYVENEKIYSNQIFIQQMKHQLGMADDACWFVSDISILNQKDLVLKATIVNSTGMVEYEDTTVLHAAWEQLDSTLIQQNSSTICDKFQNRIVFGAPGTGKSFEINCDKDELLKNGGDYERVTFHPNYLYANFVGTYKPVMVKTEDWILEPDKKEVLSILTDKIKTAQEKYDLLYDKFNSDGLTRLPLLLGLYTDGDFKTRKKDGSDAVGDNSVERNHGKYIRPYIQLMGEKQKSNEIAYEYIPGPFMRTLVKALRNARTNDPKPYLLIIEEINRANVAAVFGDVFQLLDRNEKGESVYSISATEDIKNYLAQPENLGGKASDYDEIKIPNNMFIWATMNSADQGVFPLDTAFKRRWDFQYIGINDSQDKLKYEDGREYIIPVGMKENRKYVKWNDLRTGINEMLTDTCKVNEDKLLGPFFMSKDMLENAVSTEKKEDLFVKAFESKVIMYLFEDVMKMSPEKIFKGHFDNHGKKIYSEICNSFESDGIGVFDLDIEVRDTKGFN